MEIQAVFEQCRMEQYLFSFGLFSVWGALFHREPIECQELKERRKAEDGGSSWQSFRPPTIVLADKWDTFDLNYAVQLSGEIIEQTSIVIKNSLIGGFWTKNVIKIYCFQRCVKAKT